MEKLNKSNKSSCIKFIGGLLSGALILFGAASCGQQGGGNEEPNVLADEEHVRDRGYDQGFEDDENELVANEEVDDFGRWDANADNRWDSEEFETVANESHFYHAWDTDGDGAYSARELNEGIFKAYDEDADGALSAVEFENFSSAWSKEGTLDYGVWDANKDNALDSEEFNSGIYDAGIYDEWEEEHDVEGEVVPGDRVTNDNSIFGESEIHEGLYRSWDADDDGFLSREEYLRFKRNLGD